MLSKALNVLDLFAWMLVCADSLNSKATPGELLGKDPVTSLLLMNDYGCLACTRRDVLRADFAAAQIVLHALSV
jgi:hypothetical protein